MLLTITTSHQPATDLGYLLQKHPAPAQTFDLGFGQARVFFPEAGEDLCTVALLLDIDAISAKRGRGGRSGDFALDQYVNDRPYVASSFLSVAIARVFGSALRGQCKERPDLAQTAIPLRVTINVVAARAGRGRHDTTQGGLERIRALFEPPGYEVEAVSHKLDERFPEWGDSVYFTVALTGSARLQDLLSHLYVLIPVLDDEKHYYVGEEEVEKLLARGGQWLAEHPLREAIADGYLKHQRGLTEDALLRLTDDPVHPTGHGEADDEESVEKESRLYEQRLQAVLAQLERCGAERVVDMGCGPGRLLKALMERPQFTEIVGVDVSHRTLERAQKALGVERMSGRNRDRLKLMQGSMTYRDRRIEGYDAVVLAEVVEHLDPERLPTVERALFEFARPTTILITTPNRDYNVSWPSLPAGDRRHPDHRFEWSRGEFQSWGERVAERFGYRVCFHPIGPEDKTLGAPTQMAVFTLVNG